MKIPDTVDGGTTGDLSSISRTVWMNAEGDVEDEFQQGCAPMFGRDEELKLLLESFRGVCNNDCKEAQVVTVHGPSGSGKTFLVNKLRAHIISDESNGLFCSGKYFQNSGVQEPFSAIMSAFSDLCDLVAQSPDFEKHRASIQELLGTDGKFLVKAVTNISPFLQEASIHASSSVKDTTNDAAFAKFKVACKTFLKAVSSSVGTVTMFLDDVQWMDEASRQLVEVFTNDPDLHRTLLVIAYRDEDVDRVPHTFTQPSEQLEVLDLHLGHFDPDTLHQMVSDILKNTTDPNIRHLSDIVHAKTKGNPLYVTQLMDTLQFEGLVSFDPDHKRWVFDVDEIQTTVMISTTLAELLLRKSQSLDSLVIETLIVASLLGFHFDPAILKDVVLAKHLIVDNDASMESVLSSVTAACDAGIIETTRKGCYQFCHDTLQHAFYQMVDESKAEQIHLLIGNAYLSRENREEYKYLGGAHLNRSGRAYPRDDQIRLVCINNDAASYCRETSAFAEAASFLRFGLALIDSELKWTEHFSLSFEMTESLARLELITGNLEVSRQLAGEVLSRAETTEMKFEALLVNVEVCMAGSEVEAAIDTARKALAVLDIDLPRNIGLKQVIGKVIKIKWKLWGKTDGYILGLPVCENQSTVAATRLLVDTCFFGFQTNHQIQGIYSALLAIELTLQHGLTPMSGIALLLFGIVECDGGNNQSGYRYGNLGTLVHRQLGSPRNVEAPLHSAWGAELKHWKEPMGNCWETLVHALTAALDLGDVVSAAYSIQCAFLFAISVGGKPLPVVKTFMRSAYNRFADLSHGGFGLFGLQSYQMVLNLLSSGRDEKDLMTLTGELMEEEAYLEELEKTGHKKLGFLLVAVKSHLAIYLGAFEEAEKLYGQMMEMEGSKSHQICFAATQWYFFGAIVYIQRYRETTEKQKLRKARWFKKKLLKIHKEKCPNARSYLAVIAAEELTLQTSTSNEELTAAYESAAIALADDSLPNMQALCNERAANAFSRRQNARGIAQHFTDQSLDLYKNGWGAVAIYENLRIRTSTRLPPIGNAGPFQEEQAIAIGSTIEVHRS